METIKDEGKPHNVQVSPDRKVVAYTSAVMDKKEMSQGEAMSTNGSALFYDIDIGKLIRRLKQVRIQHISYLLKIENMY